MKGAGVTPKDMYMNFWASDIPALAASGTLYSVEFPTGLSIRGELAMLIHLVEWMIYPAASAEVDAGQLVEMGLSTRQGLTAVPAWPDDGCIAEQVWKFESRSGAAGIFALQNYCYERQGFLPPIPVAAPVITLYGMKTNDGAPAGTPAVTCRIGFTTIPIDSKLYQEIAETWGW